MIQQQNNNCEIKIISNKIIKKRIFALFKKEKNMLPKDAIIL